ncbi:dethiobiotin synthase [bacterium]|nr:dethiobiotin synthase [bacterium]MBQ9246922.1 dethiobiotin synthase [bacterium]
MLNVFISGVEKQSGKTLVCAGLASTMQSLSYTTCVYKPVQSNAIDMNGFKISPDLSFIKKFDSNIVTQSTYALCGSNSPFVSSYENGVKIDINAILAEYRSLHGGTDCNILEGSNSISSPIAEYLTELDIVKTLKIPLVLVVNPKKTSIDSVISAIKYIQSEGVNILGFIVNQYDENFENLEEKYFPQIIKEYSNSNILGYLPDYGDISNLTPEILIDDVLNRINIEEVFQLKISKLQG